MCFAIGRCFASRKLLHCLFSLCLSGLLLANAGVQALADGSEAIVIRSDMAPFQHGHSVNRVTTEQKGVCVKDLTTVRETRALSSDIEIRYVRSSSDLSRALGIGAYASYLGPLTSVTASLRTIDEKTSFEERSSFYIRVFVTGGVTTLSDPQPSNAALKLLSLDKTGELFFRTCGDSFVYQSYEGAEFLAIVTHRIMDDATLSRFQADLKIQNSSANVGGDVDQRVARVTKEYEVKAQITQIGLGSVPAPSLVDASKLMEHARTFTSEVKKTQETKPYRIHLQKFEDAPAFVAVLYEQRIESLKNFDPSIKIMESIVESYALANDRANLVTNALSNPTKFKKFDEAEIRRYSPVISRRLNELQKYALDCAANTRRGVVCDKREPTELAVPPLPVALELNPVCLVASGEDDGCVKLANVEGTCRCQKCAFGKSSMTFLTDKYTNLICNNMTPGKRVRATFKGLIEHKPKLPNTDMWIHFWLGGTVYQEANILSNSFYKELTFDSVVPAEGRVETRFGFGYCMLNQNPKECTVSPAEPQRKMVEVELIE